MAKIEEHKALAEISIEMLNKFLNIKDIKIIDFITQFNDLGDRIILLKLKGKMFSKNREGEKIQKVNIFLKENNKLGIWIQ